MGRVIPSYRKFVVSLPLFGWLVAVFYFLVDIGTYRYPQQTNTITSRQLLIEGKSDAIVGNELPPQPDHFDVCGRRAEYHQESWPLQKKFATCPVFRPSTPILVLSGRATWGQTGNHLRSLFNALQYARDGRIGLAIMYNSWAMNVLLQFFMAAGNNGVGDEVWKRQVEQQLCIKIFYKPEELEGQRVILKSQEDLFKNIESPASKEEYMAGLIHTLRTLFQNYNKGEGFDEHGIAAKDMCSGIDALFSTDRSSAKYSVIHLRYLEGRSGVKILDRVSQATGCDPIAALEMSPEYIKSILMPLGMMEHPIVVITDGQNPKTLSRLKNDLDIGPMLRQVPEEACWFGGDVTLAVMSDVFIGNPASTMSGFVAKSRIALGLGNNFLHRAKNKQGEWFTTCDSDQCFFGKPRKQSSKSSLSFAQVLSRQSQMTHIPRPYFPPMSRLSSEQWQRHKAISLAQRQIDIEEARLKILARGSKVYTGLHPGEVAVRKHETL